VEVQREEEFIVSKINEGYSMARYGDGEFKMIHGQSITNMQEHNKALKRKLLKVFTKPLRKLLIGIPDPLCTRPYVEGFHKNFDEFISDKLAKINSIFISSFFSRPSLINKDSNEYFDMIKDIWMSRDIVLVNFNSQLPDHFLFQDSMCDFISIPRNNCFVKYKQIMNSCRKFYNQDKMFILSAGPTATCLAYDLCFEGEQALDMGGIAFEYSLFKGESHPEQWVYQDSYKIKRGYLRGIND